MLKFLITIVIGLFHVFSFGMYENYSIIQINTFSENKVSSVFNSDGMIIEATKLNFDQLKGYPAINRDWDGQRIAYHTGRFLAKYKNDYCLIDTNGFIIIDFCDSIQSIFLSASIYEREQSDVYLEYLHYGHNVYYQVIRKGETFLYTNNGEQLFAKPFYGLLSEEHDLYAGANYYHTRNFDWSGFGLLDKYGAILLPPDFKPLTRPYQSNSAYFVSFRNGIFNAETKVWTVFDSTGFWHQQLCYDLYLVHANEKYGVFDTEEGMIVPVEYDTIILPANHYYCHPGIKPEPLILKRKNNKKTWHFPKKYWAVKSGT